MSRVEETSEPAQGGLRRVTEVVYEQALSEATPAVPSLRIIADATLLEPIRRDHSLAQLRNVTTLPGIVLPAVGLPDMHEGYGFPVGGVAATRAPDGVISPGGIGFDINCGVRLMVSRLSSRETNGWLIPLLHELSRSVPSGYGRSGRIALSEAELDRVLDEGCSYLVRERGFGTEADLACIESNGHLTQARAARVSARAKARGHDQLGTLGGGNHFLEVQRVDALYDTTIAAALGLALDAVTVLIHTGSRGLGHQVCTDYVRTMDAALPRYGIHLPDRQLACAALSSPEGSAYFEAMCAAANFAWSNRQLLTQRVRQVFGQVFGAKSGGELRLIYDVAHNIAKMETYAGELLCVHRKGATRALGPHSAELPAMYRDTGQPIFIPGSMGTASFVLVGTQAAHAVSWGSTCHGAGRALSRGAAKRQVQGHALRAELADRGIVVSCPSNAELAEEAPLAYKDVERVVDVVERAGIAKKIARLVPLGVLKG